MNERMVWLGRVLIRVQFAREGWWHADRHGHRTTDWFAVGRLTSAEGDVHALSLTLGPLHLEVARVGD